MEEWWGSLSELQKVFAYFAIPATLVLIIQSVLVLFGIGHHDVEAGHGGHVDFGHGHADAGHVHAGDGHDHGEISDGFALFSIRGLVAFFSVGGWAGIVLDGADANVVVTVLVSLVAGFAAMLFIALLFHWTAKLQASGNIEMVNAVGKDAKVYIPIPANEKGIGKVTLTIQERYMECDAITRAPRGLKTGEFVKVVALTAENTLIVEPEVEKVAQSARIRHSKTKQEVSEV